METREEMKAQGKLSRVFAAMRMAGLIAEQNCCLDCAIDGAEKRLEEGKAVRGYVFYYGQDNDAKRAGQDFYLTFGAFEVDDDKDDDELLTRFDAEIGKVVVALCQEHGVRVAWDGNPQHRILVKWSEMLKDNDSRVAMDGIKTRRNKV